MKASNIRRRKPKAQLILRPVHPNAGIEIAYARRLQSMIDQMHNSVAYWLRAAYKANPPKVALLAQDEFSFAALGRAIRVLAKRWLAKFDDAAHKLASYYATSINNRNRAALDKIIKDSGFSIDWKATPAEKDVMGAAVLENVSLIKSIPYQYFSRVNQIVMQSVATGRDVGGITPELQSMLEAVGWEKAKAKKRAQLIAGDQNAKINAALTRVRQIDLGIDTAIWRHSHAGKHPRPTHLANDGEEYNTKTGWLDPAIGKYIWPGTEINCRCVSRSLIKGIS